jgi:uncharacterized protein involved in exopolysaccharide biosynthesis
MPSDNLPLDELAPATGDGLDLLDVVLPLAQHWKQLVAGSVLIGVAALGVSFLMPNSYTSRTLFLPPQQQQSAAAAAIAQLGALSGLAGAAVGVKTPADQYVALLQSTTVADLLVDEFKLIQVYDVRYRTLAREELADNMRVSLGKKDGLISIEVDDVDPDRAAAMANRLVVRLRELTSQLALTEAQQRGVFFEAQLAKTRDRLVKAQEVLQASGFTQGALRADARASAEGYARLRAETTAAEVRLQTLRGSLADGTPEVQQALTTLAALRGQLARLEESTGQAGGADYIGKYREFKYQETLFDLFAKQYELARVDQSREGALIQVVDEARPAERKSRPKRALIAVLATAAGALLLAAFFVARDRWRQAASDPHTAQRMAALRASLPSRQRR